MRKIAITLSFFSFILGILSLSASYAEEIITIHTYYPAPEAVYNNADTNNFYSNQTNIDSEFRKMSTGNKAILRASVSAINLLDPLNFPLVPSVNAIQTFIGRSVNVLFNKIYASELNLDNFYGSAIENLVQIRSGAQTIEQWPGLGGACRDIGDRFVANYTAKCDSDEYMVDLSEGYATWLVIGGGVGGGGGGGGWGTGIKMGSWQAKCCKIQE